MLAFVSGLMLCLSYCHSAEVTVTTKLGVVIGQQETLNTAGNQSKQLLVNLFKGIPYAKPPVGEHRWRPPQPVEAFAGGVFRAETWPDSCPNPVRSPSPFCRTCSTRSNPPIEKNSEDCLHLNIMAPVDATPKSKLAVMVYVHGGGGTVGSGRMYTQSAGLVEKNVILVTINYRLGIFGFLAHPLLSAEQGGTSGNYQIMDMIEALKFVKENIEPFGGDPDRVTVFGQSFGGSAMQYLMLTPRADPYYDAIISQSGGGTGNYATLDTGEKNGQTFFSTLGCTTLECAREKSWEDCVDTGQGRSQPIVSSNGYIPKQPADALKEGTLNKKPAIFGHDFVESHLNDYFSQNPYEYFVDRYSSDEYLRTQTISSLSGGCKTTRCQEKYDGTEAAADYLLEKLYPEVLPNNYERYSEMRTDKSNGMSTFKWCNEYHKSGAPAYRYVFRQSAEGSPGLAPFGCGHLVEDLYVFSDPEIIGPGHVMTEGELQTANLATGLWTDFAKDLKFDNDVWPPFMQPDNTGVTVEIGNNGGKRVVTNWQDEQYEFFSLWDGYCGAVYPCDESYKSYKNYTKTI
eukprot:m.109145 g.109145  ORF g.109145 m.109145 type:complete len:571 (-) comp13994_c0_seq1:149-1861(-)